MIDDSESPDQAGVISLRGVRVNNLRDIDLDIPHGQLLAICGLSGSGKTSLALDTLFAEGQRRYVECFSPYTRQFLDQLEKPDADRIDGIPPAIAIVATRNAGNARTTVGSVTETIDYLRLLFASAASIYCHQCNLPVIRNSPQEIVRSLEQLDDNRRFLIAFPMRWENAQQLAEQVSEVKRNGFRRVIIGQKTYYADTMSIDQFPSEPSSMLVVIDRLKTGDYRSGRCIEALEAAFFYGQGNAQILIQTGDSTNRDITVDDVTFEKMTFSDRLVCGKCRTDNRAKGIGVFPLIFIGLGESRYKSNSLNW